MKKTNLLALLLLIPFGIIAQNTFPTNGNVGIGTNTPTFKLDVKGNGIQIVNLATSGYLYIGRDTDPGNDSYYYTRVLNDFHTVGSNKNGSGKLRGLGFAIGGGDLESDIKMSINPSGAVGIGTNTPTFKLDVKGNGIQIVNPAISGYLYIGRDTDPGNDSYYYTRVLNDFHTVGSNKNGSGKLRGLGFAIGGGDLESDIKMSINPSGAVGIGTTNTGSHKLAVEGSIGAREIKVEGSGWSDFVFEKDYNLPTLKEVENHIKEKGHLKDIPSASEVQKNGINLGEMDAKLLQKIEELTLYTIDQQKEIEELKKQNSRIKDLEILVQKLLKDKN